MGFLIFGGIVTADNLLLAAVSAEQQQQSVILCGGVCLWHDILFSETLID